MDFLNIAVNLLIVILLLLGFHPVVESASLSLNTDKDALFAFKSQLSFETTNHLSTWDDANLSPCNWTGVTCNNLGQRVVSIDLSSLGLSGSISPHLGNLSFLRSLELQNNRFTGKLPEELGHLFRLRTLNASFNSIGGNIPSNISQCTELTTLDLMQNKISGQIPVEITRLRKFQVLNLAKNQLSGNFPSFLSNISSLVDLNLGTNMLSGPIPNDLSRLVNLKFLDLTINNLSGPVPNSIYNMSSLVTLALASNDLWGDLPGDVGVTLPNLLVFNFCFNRFTGMIPWSLHNLTNIKVIRMARNRLHGPVPPGLGNLPNLEFYNIGFNSIVSSSSGQGGLDFLELLANSTRLNFLAIDFNLFQGMIPKSIGNLSNVLTKIYMGGNNIYGPIPSSFGELRSLELLNASYCSLSGEIPQEIGKLNGLRVLALADNKLSGEIPDSLGGLAQLTNIDLSRNELFGRIPTTFENLGNLISMDLSVNLLNGSIPKEILGLSGLSVFLNLSRNRLSGPLPEEIRLLENVAVINISDNGLSSEIPSSIGECKSLEHWSLARNKLYGSIPEALGSIKGLETLDLSSNELSGNIPIDLQDLQSLQFLNLSYNKLEGDVPTRGVFSDPKNVDLKSNRNLCLSLSCKISSGGINKKNLKFLIVMISVASFLSVSIVFGLIYYMRKRKASIEDSPRAFKGQPQMIQYDELRAATNNFNQENLIGRGSFGSVYKGLVQGVESAIKVLYISLHRSRSSFAAECSALRHVRHRNLVRLITVCSSIDSKNNEFLALIYEFMSNGSLDKWIRGERRHENGRALNALERLRHAIEIASAVDYLHNETEVAIVHCDLKPSNVLLDSDMTTKVSDFGLSKFLFDGNNGHVSVSSTHTLRGSIGYIPPEYGYGEKPSTAGDVYSYGILLLELFTGKNPADEMFTGGLTIRSWVQNHFPHNLELVLEPELVQEMSAVYDLEDHHHKEHHQGNKMETLLCDCLVTIFGLGLSCTDDSPDARVSMRDALSKLKRVEEIVRKKNLFV